MSFFLTQFTFIITDTQSILKGAREINKKILKIVHHDSLDYFCEKLSFCKFVRS